MIRRLTEKLTLILAGLASSIGLASVVDQKDQMELANALVENGIFNFKNAKVYSETLNKDEIEKVMNSLGYIRNNPDGLAPSPWIYDSKDGTVLRATGPNEWMSRN